MKTDKIKIVATLGPATRSPAMLERLIWAGVDVVRLNMSHGAIDEHAAVLSEFHRLRKSLGVYAAVMADLCGPKVRTGVMVDGQAEIAAGAVCRIQPEPIDGTAARFSTSHPALSQDVSVGDRVLIDDGLIRLRVTARHDSSIECRCENGGVIGTHKGLNLPDSNLSLPALTDKDVRDVRWALQAGVEYVALSFVRGPADIDALHRVMDDAGRHVPVVVKIETPQAIRSLDEIIAKADAVLVARGDLGVEMDVWRLPILQKDMVRRCRRAGKPVIIATQMLHSMVSNATPTRAEVSDVANAVLDGADAVMLSAESAVGRYPVESVEMLNLIAREAMTFRGSTPGEADGLLDQRLVVGQEVDATKSAVARSAALIARDLGAKLIVVWCHSGTTARWIAKYQPTQPIVGLSSDETVCHQLALCYGVEPLAVSVGESAGEEASWPAVHNRIAARYGRAASSLMVVVGDPQHPERASNLSIWRDEPPGPASR